MIEHDFFTNLLKLDMSSIKHVLTLLSNTSIPVSCLCLCILVLTVDWCVATALNSSISLLAAELFVGGSKEGLDKAAMSCLQL